MIVSAISVLSSLVLLAPLFPQQPPPSESAGNRLPPFVREQGQPSAAPTPATAPAGPMRIEPFGVQDVRIKFYQPPPERTQEPRARFLFRLTGENIAKVDRNGKLIIEEMTDDAGTNLIAADTYTDRDKTGTNPVSAAANVAQNGFIMLDFTCNNPPPRTVQKIKRAKGYVNIVYGGPTEEVTIDNPLQYAGKVVDHPRLKELGVSVRILKPGEESAEPADNRGLPLKIEDGEDMIKNIDIYDEWMKRMNVRPRLSKTAAGDPYFYYQIMGGMMSADNQLVLTVHKSVKREQVKFEASDLALP